MKHSNLTNQIIIEANRNPNIKCWSNPVGMAYIGSRWPDGKMLKTYVKNGVRYGILKSPVPVKYGLCKGSNDIIGFKSEIVNGKPFARFLGMEVKTPGDTARPIQKRFIEMVNQSGGISRVVRDVEDISSI